jgi:hypothetical protein
MFLINRVKLEIIKDTSLLYRLKKWFNIKPNEYSSNPNLLEPIYKKLSTFEIEKIASFELD